MNTLNDFLMMVAAFQPKGMHAFIKEHGQAWPTNAATYKGKRGKVHMCYMNSGRKAIESDAFTYVEGYILIHGIPLHHAWLVDANGFVIDPTIKKPKEPAEYFGVAFSTQYLLEVINRTEMWGIFGEICNRELLTGKDKNWKAAVDFPAHIV